MPMKKALVPVTIIVLCLYLLIVSIVRSEPIIKEDEKIMINQSKHILEGVEKLEWGR
jgi:Na+-translocating ferredoxin:NAD+ oxidoreductase RnfC subunit